MIQSLEIAAKRSDPAARASEGVRGNDPHGALELGLDTTWKIDLAVERAPEDARLVALMEVVPEQASPDERIDVQVDHLAVEVQERRIATDPETSDVLICHHIALGVAQKRAGESGR